MCGRPFLVSDLWLEKMWWALNLPEDHEDDKSSVQRLDSLLKTSELFTSWSIEDRPTGWPVTRRVATPGGKGWRAESRSTAQGREATDARAQASGATGPTAPWVAASVSGAQGAAAAGPEAQRPRESRLAGTGERGGPRAAAGRLAGTGCHTERLGPDGLTAGLLAVERGAQLAGAARAEVSAVDQVAGGGGATGGAWVAPVVPEGAGGEVSGTAGVGHLHRWCELRWGTRRRFWGLTSPPGLGCFYTLSHGCGILHSHLSQACNLAFPNV